MGATQWGSVDFSNWIHTTFPVITNKGPLIIDPWRIRLVMLPGLLLSVPYMAIEFTSTLLGRYFGEMRREWLARIGTLSIVFGLMWVSVLSLVMLVPYAWYFFGAKGLPVIDGTLTSIIAFLVAHGMVIWGWWSKKSDVKTTGKRDRGLNLESGLVLIAASVAIVSSLVLLSSGASWAVDNLASLLTKVDPTPKEYMFTDFLLLLGALSVGSLWGALVDINQLSMHIPFKNRLARLYLSPLLTGMWQADPFTGLNARSLVLTADGRLQEYPPRLRDLLPLGYRKASGEEGRYDGPFPIFCATVTLTTGQDLATKERKATSFAFTPLYSGYDVPWTDGQPNNAVSFNGYVPTDEYAYRGGGIQLDSAVAISGPALSSDGGYRDNPTLEFLMAYFNIRRVWWISNTRKMDTWPAANGRSTPRFALIHLFKELFGKVGDGTKYVNLSDGGHFENMGLYELVRRQCSYIIVCDAEEDPEMKFEGMGGAITKCRADFGAEIDLDLRPLRKQGDSQYSQAHCTVGTIRYPPPRGEKGPARMSTMYGNNQDEIDSSSTGIIVYLKISLVGDERADLLAEQFSNTSFPQGPISNKRFTESQFELYRWLGHHIAMTSVRPGLSPQATRSNGPHEVPKLFERMHAHWNSQVPEVEKKRANQVEEPETASDGSG
jgi:hypothetical protein